MDQPPTRSSVSAGILTLLFCLNAIPGLSAGDSNFSLHSSGGTSHRLVDITLKPGDEPSAWYADSDHDGYGDPATALIDTIAPPDYVADNTDCNDQESAVNPAAAEICNGIDDNCTYEVDEGVTSVFYPDSDGDGFGNPAFATTSCSAPEGYVLSNADCNDANPAVNPNASEICNGIDDNCNSLPDDGLPYGEAEILWDFYYGGSANDYGQCMDYTPDGNIIIAGYTHSVDGNITANHGGFDIWVLKTDLSGNILWQRTYGGSLKEHAYDIKATADSGFIVAGYTESNDGDVSGNHGGLDMWVIKLDHDGNPVWQKTYGGTKTDICYVVIPTPDGGYALAGTTYSSNGDFTENNGAGDYCIIKIDQTGNIQWQKVFGGSAFDFAHALDLTPDGGYYLSGYARSTTNDVAFNYGQEDMWILKLDSLGNLVWQKSYGGTGGEGATWLQTTTDGGCILTGITHSTNVDVVENNGMHDIWVVKVDSNGNKEWAKCLGGSDTEDGHFIIQTADGGYLVTGKSDSEDGMISDHAGSHDYWVVKLNESGSLVWEITLGDRLPDEPYSLLEAENGSFYVLGYGTPFELGQTNPNPPTDFWLVKCSAPLLSTYYQDADSDGYGNPYLAVTACQAPMGFVPNSQDCNDADESVHPLATEDCNGIDDDCDYTIDDGHVVAIISPLTTVTICNTSSVTYESNMDSLLSYQWLVDGSDIPGATTASYTTSVAGSYSVRVTDGECQSVSPESILKVTDQNESISPAGTVQVCPKTSLVLAVEENPGMSYQWYKNSVAISGATNMSFLVTGNGTFVVTETDVTGCSFVTSPTIVKNFSSPKTQITAQGSLKLCINDSVIFQALVNTGYTYQWYLENAPIAGATQSTYVATSAGNYKYQVTTMDGCTAFSKAKTVSDCRMSEEDSGLYADQLLIFPNPAYDRFYVKLTGDTGEGARMEIRIHNTLGQCIYAEDEISSGGEQTLEINPDYPWPPGPYLVTLSCDKLKLTKILSVVK
jgi:hypothetical protein